MNKKLLLLIALGRAKIDRSYMTDKSAKQTLVEFWLALMSVAL